MNTYTWIDFLTFIGSIGLFLYGMKLMSEGLQKIAGDRLRAMLASMPNNRFLGAISGMIVTALAQSSSATTAMIASFVNAKLITLAESMAVVIGANVGTSVIVWIIALCGFKFGIEAFILPLIAIALPLFNSTHSKRNTWGELTIGFALLFLSIEILKQAVPDLSSYPTMLSTLHQLCSMGYGSVLLFLLFGLVLTLIVQSTSVAFPITILMCTEGWFSFEMGCAMIVGSNIGTCILPFIASFSASTMARRTTLGHLLFNAIGSIWAVALYQPFGQFISWLCTSLAIGDPAEPANVCLGMAMYHTVFNLANLILLLGFTRQLEKIVARLIPQKKEAQNLFKTQYIDNHFVASGEIALLQARKGVNRFADDVYRMFVLIRAMLAEPLGSSKQTDIYEKVKDLEEQSDKAEIEIADYMNKIDFSTLSYDGEMLSRRLYKMVDELESIADCIYQIACTLKRKSEERIYFTEQQNKDIGKMISMTDEALVHMNKSMEKEELSESAMIKAYNYEDEINNFRTMLRNQLMERKDSNRDHYQQSTYYMDLISECEKTGDYIINVMTAMNH